MNSLNIINYELYLHNDNISLHREKVNNATQQIVHPLKLCAFMKEAKLAGMVNFHQFYVRVN